MRVVLTAARILRDAGRSRFGAWLACAMLASAMLGARDGAAQLPSSMLAVRRGDSSVTWWTSAAAPTRWPAASPTVLDAIAWEALATGAEWGSVSLAGSGEASRLQLVVVRIARAALKPRLVFPRPQRASWTIDSAPASAIVAINVGQFAHDAPWGWVVADRLVRWSPGRGPYSMALAWDNDSALRWIRGRDVALAARRHPPPKHAVQSYPVLLDDDGTVPTLLRRANDFVSVGHRDARLAIGEDREGRLVIAFTRFAALGEMLGRLPFGVTTPEMAAVMGALGCRVAVALDGGSSAQLLVRRASGETMRWPGLRAVPMGLVFER